MIWTAVEIGVNLYQGMLMVYFMHVRLRQKPHPQWLEPLFACLAALFLTAQPLLFPFLPDTFVFLIPMALGFMASAERKAVVFMWSLILCSVFIGVVIAFGNVLTALTGREWDALLEQSSLRLVFMVGSNLALTFVLSLLAHIRKQEYSIPVAATVCFFVLLLLEFLINELLYMYQLHSPDPGSALFVYISLGIMASVCLTICLFEKMNKVIRQRRDAEQALYAQKLLHAHQEELQSIYADMMAAQHDLRHRVQAAEQLLQGASGQAADAASRLLDDDNTIARFMTGSMAVDAVLTVKAAAMEKAGISFHFVPYPLHTLPLDETSFAVLLSNLLDNAREGVMRLPADAPSRAVTLTISRTWNMYCVTCRNDADPATIHRQGDRFLSSKDQPGLHGYGTESIRSAVEAAGGVCRFMVKGHSFMAELWLPEEHGQ